MARRSFSAGAAQVVSGGFEVAPVSLSRRAVIAVLATASLRAVRLRAAQDEVTDADLERGSLGRVVRVGSPATGTWSSVPLEVYVARVLAAESDPRAMDAAREALAVAIRTYALVNEGRHARDGYDVCDTTHCQVSRAANATTRRLTQNTALQVLTFAGRPAALYYSASCGGHSERAEDVWAGTSYPYLQARPDEVHENEVPWTLDLSIVEVDAALKRIGCAGQLSMVRVQGRTPSGRVAALHLEGLEPAVLGSNDFRLAVGSTRLRSTAFSLVADAQSLRFIGRGYGHGVGMCVIGAGTRALRGATAQDILAHYYPGLELVRLTPADGGRAEPPRPQPFPIVRR